MLINSIEMKKRITAAALIAAAIFAAAPVKAQTSANPTGTIIYSLPNTAIHLTVTAEKEIFAAGPYARFAQKYLGNEARTDNGSSYRIKSIDLTPYIEADSEENYSVELTSKDAPASNFLQFCSQGLIAIPDSYTGKSENWRFPSLAASDAFIGKEVSGNLTSTTTTLYKNEKTEDGFRKVAVQQSQVVEKSLESKAAEAAQTIFNLRKSRVQIITGDTDATFSGEALKAAIDEITRLEEQYLTLFYGITETSCQTMNFDVVPTANNAKQMYVAFRISDTDGLLPASGTEGRPVILQLTNEVNTNGNGQTSDRGIQTSKNSSAKKAIRYRSPATVTARIMDGADMILQTRFPVYQLGQTFTYSF